MSEPHIKDRLHAIIRSAMATDIAIAPDTEIYYDLHISGDDLDDMLDAVVREFGTDLSAFRLNDFAPSEGVEIMRPLLKALGIDKASYKSLTVQALTDAIAKGRWE